MGRDSLGVAMKTVEIEGGVEFVHAAVSEGFCPASRDKLKPVPADFEISDEPYPSTPQARGWCSPCHLVWTIGEHHPSLADEVAGLLWAVIDDNWDGGLRRMAWNPAPEDPDRAELFTLYREEYEYDDDQ